MSVVSSVRPDELSEVTIVQARVDLIVSINSSYYQRYICHISNWGQLPEAAQFMAEKVSFRWLKF